MGSGWKRALERLRRGIRTAFFMLTMVASLLVLSAPVLVAFGDVSASLWLATRFACARCYGVREHLSRYGFRSSLMDIPLVSAARSLIIACVYSLCNGPRLSHGPYLGTTTICCCASFVILAVKACVFTPLPDIDIEALFPVATDNAHFEKTWAMPILLFGSLAFALGHVVVAYRTSCKERRKLSFHRLDPESVLSCKNVFSGCYKIPRSPTPCGRKNSRSNSETKWKLFVRDEQNLPISLLADADSLFIACQGLTLHYKRSQPESRLPLSFQASPFPEVSPGSSPPSNSSGRHKFEWPLSVHTKRHCHLSRSFSSHFHNSSLYSPLLEDASSSPTFCSSQIPVICLNDSDSDVSSHYSGNLNVDLEGKDKSALILIHGFGGGVFSWRHVMDLLARQVGCTVVAFDRPGWGLTCRPQRKDWEDKKLPNPYTLEAQVDLIVSFCLVMGFSSVVLVGHDDGGLLALKVAEKVRSSFVYTHLDIKGVVLLSVSLSREVVPAFSRILLHTSLGKKHMVRPLLRTEITQVINRRAWFDATKLTPEILNLYKAPLCVDGWDEALHEIGRLSFSTVLSPQKETALLKSVEDLPVLLVAGAEDALVPLKSVQTMATNLVNSRLVAISGCGHLPHEECPKALLAALTPFISRLLTPPSSPDASTHHSNT